MEQDARKMLETHRGRYLLVNSISQRVKALQSGYKPLVPRGSNDLDVVATEEIRQDKLRVRTLEDEKGNPDES
ncbi:DNA-directed RNA polymerase subunit omega [Candidatus Sumerlaeota bacterium]|nr:DNA-directed RNA polymerase subunit omega [Candidatus Sumerlaeota bacterium]